MIEAMKQALEALEDCVTDDITPYQLTKAITVLRQAIEQAQKQETVDTKLDGVLRKAIVRSGIVIHPTQHKQEPVAWPTLTTDEREALERFNETCEDGEGYDVPKQMMRRLAEIGVVHHLSRGIYGITQFGRVFLGYTSPPQRKPPQFPTMLRKMWSGSEVQDWINENWNKG